MKLFSPRRSERIVSAVTPRRANILLRWISATISPHELSALRSVVRRTAQRLWYAVE